MSESDPAADDSLRQRWLAKWRAVPGPIRKSVVLTIGVTLLAIGGALIVLPGPFTLPFVIAGIAILSSEFVWAERIMEKGQEAGALVKDRVGRIPTAWLIVIGVWLVAAVGVVAWWWVVHRPG